MSKGKLIKTIRYQSLNSDLHKEKPKIFVDLMNKHVYSEQLLKEVNKRYNKEEVNYNAGSEYGFGYDDLTFKDSVNGSDFYYINKGSNQYVFEFNKYNNSYSGYMYLIKLEE